MAPGECFETRRPDATKRRGFAIAVVSLTLHSGQGLAFATPPEVPQSAVWPFLCRARAEMLPCFRAAIDVFD